MRPASRYPVDRYLVESSKRMDIIEIMDDDLWKPEPALRPEDEFLLRKLHDMLQSTSDDLKVLSGELSKYHESGVQVKTLPTPLDEDFNEKIHVEDVVNAKFHGNKIINPLPSTSQKSSTPVQDLIATEIRKQCSTFNRAPKEIKKAKKLAISRTKVVHIPESANDVLDTKHLDLRNKDSSSLDRAVQYTEVVHQECIKGDENSHLPFKVQELPSINIRSELQVQHVAHLDITPESKTEVEGLTSKNNTCVISVNHDIPSCKSVQKIEVDLETPPVRKISKMSPIESSDSSPNIVRKVTNIKQKMLLKEPKKQDTRRPETFISHSKKAPTNLNDWKRKLSSVYGQSSRDTKPQFKLKNTSAKLSNSRNKQPPEPKEKFNNHAEYIPYAKLTLGGVHVKDIEEEISHVQNIKDLPLSPILDKILSRQNSFSYNSLRNESKSNAKVLTTSDENLLQEVLDLEEKVSITLSKTLNQGIDKSQSLSKYTDSNKSPDNTYADDFEADNSNGMSEKSDLLNANKHDSDVDMPSKRESVHNKTYVKVSNLSLKNKIETFEFIHTIETQENATQSNAVNKISLKQTQTSPTSDSIRNESIDPRHEVENMFKLEKDFIKKLIINEYSDLIDKPSTSKETHVDDKNTLIQKNTQTSPARVKSVMTSPTRTKTRTTSPLPFARIDKQTSPLTDVKMETVPSLSESSVNLNEFDITINLSSPRFQLQLPKSASKSNLTDNNKLRSKFLSSSSSSVDDSSDVSLGEMRRFKRRLRRHKVSSPSDRSSSTSKYSEHSFVVPLRSEGEISLGQTKSKHSKSEGEMSLGQLR